MPTTVMGRRGWNAPLVIIPPVDGKEPKSMFPYIARTMLAFKLYGPCDGK